MNRMKGPMAPGLASTVVPMHQDASAPSGRYPTGVPPTFDNDIDLGL